MLRFMRKYATGWLVKGLFGIIIAVFVLYFGSSNLRQSEKIVAEVGPYKITYTEYLETYNRFSNLYRLMYKDKFNEKELKLKEKVTEELINKYLLLSKANDMGLHVSDTEFNEHLANMDTFKVDGKFSKKVYLDILKRNGIEPKRFEESEKANLAIFKITGVIIDNGLFMDESRLWDGYVKEKGKVNLGYMVFNPSLEINKVNVNEKELQELYEKEKGAYKGQNLYRLKYIVIDAKSSVRDDTVYMELLRFNDIEAYGKKNGLEVSDTGMIKENELLKKFKGIKMEEWIKGLRKGDVSLPARDSSRSFIFKLIDMEEGKPFEKSTVLKELKEKIALDKAKVFTRTKAEETISKKSFRLENETGFIPRNLTEISKIGSIPKEHIGILALSKNREIYEKPIEISGKYYIFSFKGEKLPEKNEWEKAKKGYAENIMAVNREEYFKSFIEELKKKEKIEVYSKEF